MQAQISNNNHSTNNHNSYNNHNNIYMMVPYTSGVSESFKNICDEVGIQVHFGGGNIIKNLLMAPPPK